MVPLALLAGLATVEEVMLDPDFTCFIDELFNEELIPMLDLPQEELIQYAEQIKERFKNPYVHHQLQSIALNSVSKFKSTSLAVVAPSSSATVTAAKNHCIISRTDLLVFNDRLSRR